MTKLTELTLLPGSPLFPIWFMISETKEGFVFHCPESPKDGAKIMFSGAAYRVKRETGAAQYTVVNVEASHVLVPVIALEKTM